MTSLLILGGTHFIGRNLLLDLIKSGEYDITLFNRGITNTALFPEIKKIIGDRNTDDVTKLAGKQWDYVIDLSCYYPASLERVLEVLEGRYKRYVFISTCSVYDGEAEKSELRDETAPILACTPSQRDDTSPATYGERKAECERVLQQRSVDYVIFRPALVYGAYDPTDRFYYWLYQVKHHDPILVPDAGERRFSVTYVQDLVKGIVQALAEDSPSGIFTLTSTPQTSIRHILTTACQLLHKHPDQVNAPPAFLHEQEISQWTDMPLWIDNDFFTYSHQRFVAAYDFQPCDFVESVKATIAYFDRRGWETPVYGLDEGKRRSLLQALERK